MNLEEELKTKLAKPNQTIRDHTDRLKTEAKRLYDLDYISKELYDLLVIACEYHDYGKLNEEFQYRVNKIKARFNDQKEISHNILSILFLPRDCFDNEEDYYIILMSILYHHKLRNQLMELVEEKKELIKEFIEAYKDNTISISKLRPKMAKKITDLINDQNSKAIIIKGLLHKCDYSASAGIESEYPNDFLEKKLNDLQNKWKKVDEKVHWNQLQKFCMENTNKNIIVTAPTGMGKTEAGLWWIGNHKGFFVLPLRTAINAMYERIATVILNKENIPERLALLHSDMKAYYLEDDIEETNVEEYIERTSQMALPLTISTLDQLFDFVFQYSGYEYKLAQLSYSKIVIDEIQMYDPTLLAFLIYGIERIHKVGGRVAVLTATLPPFVRQEIQSALDGDFIEADYSSGGDTRHNIQVLDEQIDSNDIRSKYEQLVLERKSAKILVVCNSIENGQDLYNELSDLNAKLLHSKFIKRDRSNKEKEILDCGKTYCDKEEKNLDEKQEIWISTSLVEASLDIDFDYLFTELNDVFSLFQRLGRCNRKGAKKWYLDEPNCYVYTEARGKVAIYLKKSEMHRLSKEAVETIQGVLTESQKNNIIETYMSADKVRTTKYANDYNYMKQLIADNPPYESSGTQNLRDIATVDVIPNNVYGENKMQIDNLVKQLEEETSKFDRIKVISLIKEYCLSIYSYEKDRCKTVGTVELNCKFSIPIVECEYSYERGYIKNNEFNRKIEDDRLNAGGVFID